MMMSVDAVPQLLDGIVHDLKQAVPLKKMITSLIQVDVLFAQVCNHFQ